MIYGSSFSREAIDAELPMILRHASPALLPWYRKDRREAETGGTFWDSKDGKDCHDRQGLDYARRELRRIQADLATEKPLGLGDAPNHRHAILTIMAAKQQAAVEFWEGKCYLLDRVIAAMEAQT